MIANLQGRDATGSGQSLLVFLIATEPNQRLSESRAYAVKSYLVDAAGIPMARVSAKGVDSSNPVTKPGSCVGRKPTPKLIACLQPDRRVDVEVTGTR